jgi:hypothetical protein
MTWRLFPIAVERAAPVMKKCHRRFPYKQVANEIAAIIQNGSFMCITVVF